MGLASCTRCHTKDLFCKGDGEIVGHLVCLRCEAQSLSVGCARWGQLLVHEPDCSFVRADLLPYSPPLRTRVSAVHLHARNGIRSI